MFVYLSDELDEVLAGAEGRLGSASFVNFTVCFVCGLESGVFSFTSESFDLLTYGFIQPKVGVLRNPVFVAVAPTSHGLLACRSSAISMRYTALKDSFNDPSKSS